MFTSKLELRIWIDGKVSKGAKIRNRYNQVSHLTQDTNGKVTNSNLDKANNCIFTLELLKAGLTVDFKIIEKISLLIFFLVYFFGNFVKFIKLLFGVATFTYICNTLLKSFWDAQKNISIRRLS